MESFQNDVFISHASEDKVLVARPLAVALESRGYSVWLDENRLTIGRTRHEAIKQAIRELT
jgi:hypothetical protein